MSYWLFKSDPDDYSYHDLMIEPTQSTDWGGVRNYQARNLLRDQVGVGDQVLFYRSSTEAPAIVGIAEVLRAGHPDPTASDPKGGTQTPTWYQVTIRAVSAIDPPLTLSALRAIPALAGMELLRKGSRLSIQAVRPNEWRAILRLRQKPRKGK